MHTRTPLKALCLTLALLAALCAGGFAVLACPPEGVGGHILTVQNIKQYPELPHGCEITSLAIVLNYLGFEVSKLELADEWLPKAYGSGRYGPNPETTYVGNPRTTSGWYCWAPALVTAADEYLANEGSELVGIDITGEDRQLIYDYIDCDIPVVAWVTIDWGSAPRKSRSYSWLLEDGTRYTPYTNVHCLVISGYDEDIIHVTNPLSDTTDIDADVFWAAFEAMGSRAMVVGMEVEI